MSDQLRGEAAPDKTDDLICGLNILKVARNINLIAGSLLVACCAFNLFNLFQQIELIFTEPGIFLLNIYLG
jgi:hypothetical protein